MAVIPKEVFDRRRESFWDHMEKQKEIRTLTEEKHNILSELAELRHRIHTCGDGMYLTESADYGMWEELRYIREKLRLSGLGDIEFNEEEVPTDNDRYYGIIEDSDEAEKENREEYYESISELNEKIEDFLKKIDEKHGTNYAPTGAFRNKDLL